MTLQTYQYVVLRCVPRAEREEFVNVGVVLRSQGHDYLRAAFALDEARLVALWPDLDVAAVHAALEVVCDVALGRTGGGRPDLDGDGRRFGWISAPRSTAVHRSRAHDGLTQDPAAELVEQPLELVR